MRVKAGEILIGLSAALLLALVVARFATSSPDGLEKVAERQGFLAKGEGEPRRFSRTIVRVCMSLRQRVVACRRQRSRRRGPAPSRPHRR